MEGPGGEAGDGAVGDAELPEAGDVHDHGTARNQADEEGVGAENSAIGQLKIRRNVF